MPKHDSIIISLRPRKPEGSLGRTAQDGHLDSYTAPELCNTVHFDRNPFTCPCEGSKKALMVSNLALLLDFFRATARQALQ